MKKHRRPRAAGSITAALFLKQFVKNTRWAHLDIAGPVWSDKESGYNSPGATGYGVRMLVQWGDWQLIWAVMALKTKHSQKDQSK